MLVVLCKPPLLILRDDEVEGGGLIDSELNVLGLAISEPGCLVYVVGVVVQIADIDLVKYYYKLLPIYIENAVLRLVNHPILQSNSFLFLYLRPKRILNVIA